MQEESETLSKFRQPLLKDLPYLYIMGIIVALAHLGVGVIWQSISIQKTENTKMTYPYIGGYINLVSIAFLLIMVYFMMMLGHEPDIPKNLRRFALTLSALLLLVQCAIVIIFSIRANDIRTSKEQLTNLQYGFLFSATLLDILLTIISLPLFFYFVYINKKTVYLTPDQSQVEVQNQGERRQDIREHELEPANEGMQVRIESSQSIKVDVQNKRNALKQQIPQTTEQNLQLILKCRQRQNNQQEEKQRIENPLISSSSHTTT